MPVQPENFIKDVKAFMEETLRWCKEESEKESSTILMALHKVMEDVQRRSKMSAVAEASLLDAQDRLKVLVKEASHLAVQDLLAELRSLQSNNAEVNRLVNPVIEALQFQDRLAQNMRNMEKMIHIWFDFEKIHPKGQRGEPEEEELCTELLKAVTTLDERKLILKNFPNAINIKIPSKLSRAG